MTPPQGTRAESSVHAFTIRMPEDLFEELRQQAFDERTSINALIVAAIRATKASHA